MILHPWHLISPGENAPKTVNSIIEIPRGTKAKYELDKNTGLLRLDRVLMTDLTYPAHYGFIPQTYCEDNDPLDIIVICSEPLFPLTIVEATVLGAFQVIDGGEKDDKLVAVTTHDKKLSHIKDLDSLPHDQLAAIRNFFENYKKQESKTVIIERVMAQKEAQKLVTSSINRYNEKFKNNE